MLAGRDCARTAQRPSEDGQVKSSLQQVAPEGEGLGWRLAGVAALTYLTGRGRQLRSLPAHRSESGTKGAERLNKARSQDSTSGHLTAECGLRQPPASTGHGPRSAEHSWSRLGPDGSARTLWDRANQPPHLFGAGALDNEAGLPWVSQVCACVHLGSRAKA